MQLIPSIACTSRDVGRLYTALRHGHARNSMPTHNTHTHRHNTHNRQTTTRTASAGAKIAPACTRAPLPQRPAKRTPPDWTLPATWAVGRFVRPSRLPNGHPARHYPRASHPSGHQWARDPATSYKYCICCCPPGDGPKYLKCHQHKYIYI